MHTYQFDSFGIDHLKLIETSTPEPGPGQITVQLHALSLNYRDILVVKGLYNPKLKLPAIPISDGAGVVTAVGDGVERFRAGDRVMSHFVSGWTDGPFRQEYLATTLGCPETGLAAEHVILPAEAAVQIPAGMDFPAAATLPIAALTAWSALVTVNDTQPDQTILTLGTGGVSIFTLQLAKALGARVMITSSSDEKLARARELGADGTINYAATPEWERSVLEFTNGLGVDLTVETVGATTLEQSLKATRATGKVALLGALKGLSGNVNTGLILMKRLQIHGIMVDSRTAFENLCRFIEERQIVPVISQTFPFDELPAAFHHLEAGEHFGKVVIEF